MGWIKKVILKLMSEGNGLWYI